MFAQLRSDISEMLHEQVTYREVLLQMVRRDLLLRYKQTIMGFGWAIFTPIINTLIFSVIFTRVARLETGMPYPLFAYSGFMAWNLFASSLRGSVNSLTGNTSLVTKVFFPREIFPFSAVFVALVDFTVSSTILIGFLIYYRIEPHWTILFVPVIVVVQVMFTAGVALLLAMANLFFRDVKYLFEVVLMFWMFASSVVYPTFMVGGLLSQVLLLNPMTPIIDAYRGVLIRGELPPAGPFGLAAALAVVTLAVGWTVFHRAEFKFAENV